jgi:ergothioneine biosynthesis protein EgtB
MSIDNALWVQQNTLRLAYVQTRRHTLDMVQGLSAEDCLLQSMEETSPVKWQLAHTTWFFETFVLARSLPGFQPCDPAWRTLFNSYYLSLGEPYARARRGLLSRPSLAEVMAWREYVDTQMLALFASPLAQETLELIELGINHEEQHQELILTDLKHHFWCNPLRPVYRPAPPPEPDAPPISPGSLNYRACEGGLTEIGHAGGGFAFDNEMPCHRVWLPPFEMATRLVTNGEYLAFMVDGGYGRAELWLADGWERRVRENWHAPLYWLRSEDQWCQYTLTGLRPLRLHEPVCHISYYEADAYARWARARLPSEAEWEHAAFQWQAGEQWAAEEAAEAEEAYASQPQSVAVAVSGSGHFTRLSGAGGRAPDTVAAAAAAPDATAPDATAATGTQAGEGDDQTWSRDFFSFADAPATPALHPEPAASGDLQLFGTVWQWTRSAYLPYPGFRTPPGPVGEYNGKFMSNQMVLRGGSCVTPRRHMRLTYRNFFAPPSRWQFSGLRLARDL